MVSKIDVICDRSQKNLNAVPRDVMDMSNLQMLYLESNSIEYLPLNLFQKLPRLTWLDLRNNQLREIPTGVAHHQYLDTLLLENNQLEKLPNELGLCPNLLVLQINGNPLIYPHQHILEQGAVTTCEYLKAQFTKENPEFHSSTQNSSSDNSPPSESIASYPSEPVRLPNKKKMSVQELLRKASTAAKLLQKDTPVMMVKSLSPKNSITQPTMSKTGEISYEEERDNSKMKKKPAMKYCPKLSVNSHFNSNKYLNVKKSKPNKERVIDQNVKDLWLSKLKELLDQQEKLLQQERNLKALNAWRFQKKMEPLKKVQQPKIKVPYDTDPQYETMLQREDLYKEVDNMVRRKKRFTRTVDLRKMISEIVLQLKALEAQHPKGNSSSESERNSQELERMEERNMKDSSASTLSQKRAFELARAENEIRRIIDLHKKVTALQTVNSSSL